MRLEIKVSDAHVQWDFPKGDVIQVGDVVRLDATAQIVGVRDELVDITGMHDEGLALISGGRTVSLLITKGQIST